MSMKNCFIESMLTSGISADALDEIFKYEWSQINLGIICVTSEELDKLFTRSYILSTWNEGSLDTVLTYHSNIRTKFVEMVSDKITQYYANDIPGSTNAKHSLAFIETTNEILIEAFKDSGYYVKQIGNNHFVFQKVNSKENPFDPEEK